MDRSNDNSQHAHTQNLYNRFKRNHDTTRLSPGTDVLRLEKRRRIDNGERWQDSVTTNTGTGGSHAHQLGVSVTGQEELDIGTHESQPQVQAHTASHAQSTVPADVMQSNNMFQNAQHVNISGNPNFYNIGSVTNVYGDRTDGLQNLNGFVSFEAQFDSSAQDPDRQCHPGTRQNVLKRLRDWIDNPNSTERIFWLYGPAGAGKSAIAQTIARSYAQPKVAGTFFFFRSDVNRNDGNRLFTTLAYQLAHSVPEIREHIAHSLYKRPDLPRADVETQFKQLLAWPFQVLSDDATQHLAPVIVIDGIDECSDEILQRRFLKVIGDAVVDDRFPLRFLIVSRPEVHIEQTIRRLQTPFPTIDLASLDDANRDIEKYLVDEFSRIASEQGLDPAWPGQEIIDDIVYKSSGNFIYASVVIRFVGDPYCFAKTQLDIVMNMKPPKTLSPFAVLDQLFLEILRRVPDQKFLKRYLALLTARISVSRDYGDLHEDDAVLMHVSDGELHANLRRLLSLLKFKPGINVHHRSFLDFLYDSSRSGQYHIRKPSGIKEYLEVFVDSLVQYASAVIKQPDCHSAPHFNPRFRGIITTFPPKIGLLANEWQEVIRPLLDLQDTLLQIPNFSTCHFLPCDDCTVFHLLRDLLHLGLHLGISKGRPNDASIQLVMNVRKRRGAVSSTTTNIKKVNGNDLDSLLLSLFAHLPEAMENWLPNKHVVQLMSAILHFDSAEVARSVHYVSDAQKLVELFAYMIRAKNANNRIHPNAIRKACLLALEIFSRVPILPLSFLWDGGIALIRYTWRNHTIPTQILSQTVFASRLLDRYYIVPILGGYTSDSHSLYFRGEVQGDSLSISEWRRGRITVPPVTIRQVMLELAKAIQYFHSLGVILHHNFALDNVFLDSGLRPKVRCWCSTSRFLLDQQWRAWFLPEDNILSFGCIFYGLVSGVDTMPSLLTKERRRIISECRTLIGIPEYAWQLIQRCCAEDLGSRPTIDEVVEVMENWKIE